MRSLSGGQARAKRGARPRKRMIPLEETPPLGHLYKDPPKGPEGLALQAEHTIRTHRTETIAQESYPTCLFLYRVPV